jgi:hypothetical protein
MVTVHARAIHILVTTSICSYLEIRVHVVLRV